MCESCIANLTLPINNLLAYAALSCALPRRPQNHAHPNKNAGAGKLHGLLTHQREIAAGIMKAGRAGGRRLPLPWASLWVKAAALPV